MSKDGKPSANEGIKDRSNYLRGTIEEGLQDLSTGGLSKDDQQLIKFHGSYQQDDRDLRAERRKHKLEKAFSFMIRIRVPGGVSTPRQWIEMDRMASQFGNETFKLTTRQAFQLHGVIKTNLKRTIREINDTALEWAHDFCKEMTDEETGRTGYTKAGERPVRAEGRLEQFPADQSESLTGVGMLIRIFAGEDPKASADIKAGAELCAKRLPVWEPKSGKVDMYYWYYATLSMFQVGGGEWTAWNNKMKTAIIDHQREEGNFGGSWDPCGPWGEDGGRVYSTAVMTMCMEPSACRGVRPGREGSTCRCVSGGAPC